MKRRLALTLALAAAGASAPAAAQSLRPNILVIFDTSGSMQLDATSSWAGERVNEATPSPETCFPRPRHSLSRIERWDHRAEISSQSKQWTGTVRVCQDTHP